MAEQKDNRFWKVLGGVAGGSFVLSAVLGVAVNRLVVAPLLALPEGEGLPAYEDAAPAQKAEKGGAKKPLAGADAADPEEGDTPEARPVAAASAGAGGRALPLSRYIDDIVKRNIFDSSAVYSPGGGEINAQGGGECKSEASAKLLATVVAEPMEYSSALILESGAQNNRAKGYKVGDMVVGEGKIASIDQNKVCLDSGSCLCIGVDAKLAKAAGGEGKAEGDKGGVTKNGDNSFTVDKSFLDSAMSDLSAFAGQIRATPHKGADGEIDGFRLSAIRRGSVFEKLGIKNGDIIHSVNGQPLTNAQNAMGMYSTMKDQKSFSFEITRRNQKQTMSYEVR